MPNEGISSGYYGFYKPNYSILDPSVKGSVYVVSSYLNNSLVLIPLVPNFFVDIVNIVNNLQSRNITIVVPDIGPRFISDYLSSWYYIKKVLGFDCKLFSKYLPEDNVSEEFIHDIIINKHNAMSIIMATDEMNTSVIHIQLTKMLVETTAPYACDVILNDTIKRRTFLVEANEEKMKYLNSHDLCDEIYTPFIEGAYPTMSYAQILRKFPGLIKKIFADRFGSRLEFEEARARGVHIGKLVTLR